MKVGVMSVVEFRDSGASVKEIEEAVTLAWRKFASAAWNACARAIERRAEEENRGRLRRKGMEERTLLTTAGNVRFKRQRYKDQLEEKSYVLFDLRTGLKPYARVTPAAKEAYAKLAAISPSYRRAGEEAETVLGDAPSTMAIWGWTQGEGERLREVEKADQPARTRWQEGRRYSSTRSSPGPSSRRRISSGSRRTRRRCTPGGRRPRTTRCTWGSPTTGRKSRTGAGGS